MLPPSSPSSGPAQGEGRLVLLAALVLGGVRLLGLSTWSLWIDEAYTVADWGAAADQGRVFNPWGYRAVRLAVEALGGEPEAWKLRLLPALVGWLCIPLAAWSFRPFAGGRRAAWVALLLALSPWHVFWSQNARFYTLAMATSLVGSGFYLRGVFAGRLRPALIGLGLANAGALFHPTALLLVPLMALAPRLATWLGASRGEAFDALGRALARLFWLSAFAGSWVLGAALLRHIEEKGTGDLTSGALHLALTAGYFITPVVLAGAAWGLACAWRGRDSLGLMAGVVVVGVGLVSLVLGTAALMTAQYVFCLLPWVLLLATAPLDALERRPRLAAGWLFLLVGSAVGGLGLYMTSRHGERPRWEEAYAYVDARREPGDLVLGMAAPVGELYLGGADVDPRRPRTVSALGDWFPEGPARWARHPRRTWVIVRPQWLASLRPGDRARLESWLSDEGRLVQRLPAPMEGRDLELVVYLREP